MNYSVVEERIEKEIAYINSEEKFSIGDVLKFDFLGPRWKVVGIYMKIGENESILRVHKV